MEFLKENRRVSKVVSVVGKIVYSANFKEVCEGFFGIKKLSRESKLKEQQKKSIVIKFMKKEVKEK